MKEFKYFIKQLKTDLQNELPAYNAQKHMEPATRKQQIIKFNKKSIDSSVLILFYQKNNQIYTVFIKRPEYDGVHSGQIAFPGGRYEKQDDSLHETALRETNEEIGISTNEIKIIGNLSKLFIPPSNFNVLPVVAYMNKSPVFNIDSFEVEKTIEVKLKDLMDKNIKLEKEVITSENKKVIVPCYYYDGHIIWGATAMILSELIEIIRRAEI